MFLCVSSGEEMKPGDTQPDLPKDAGEATIARLDKLRQSKGPLSTAQIRNKMQRVMQVRPDRDGEDRHLILDPTGTRSMPRRLRGVYILPVPEAAAQERAPV